MKPTVFQIAVGQMANFTYIVSDEENGEAAIIDPSWDLDKIFHTLKKNNWQAAAKFQDKDGKPLKYLTTKTAP